MVPHSSVCAKSIQHISTYSSEIAPKDWQTADKFACRQPYSQPSLELSRHEHLHLCQPAQSPARERAGQAQVPDIDYKTTSNTRLAGRKPSCAICECTYSEIRGALEIVPYAASGALNPDGDHARTRGSLQPDQTNREPLFCSPQLAEFLLQCLKGKQTPLPDGCAAAVSDSLAFSFAQAKAQRALHRPSHLSADPEGQGRYQHGFMKDSRQERANCRKRLPRPENTAAKRISSPTAASARTYFWHCGVTRGRKRGHPQAVGAYRTPQRPACTHRALQKVMSVETRRHRKDNM